MAINKKLIHFKLKSSFETELANNNLLDTSIVFIQETKEIWTHGQLYKCSDPDLSNYVKESELQELLSPIQSSLANKLEVSDLAGYAKTSDIPAVVTDSTVSNWGFMKTSDANETYAPKSLVETVSNQSTTISTLATKNELSTGLAGKLDNSAASSFVPTTRTINGTALTDDIWITATDPNAATKDELNGLATTVANKADVSALANFATTDALSSGLSGKQETLVSGTNIKTIEGKSILGSGDIQITAAEVGAYTTGQVDEKVTALNNAISGKADPSTVNAVSDRVSALEGYFSTAEDSDATINKWGEIVNFLDGVAEGSNVEQLLAAKANQSALDNLSTTVSNVDAKFANYLPLSGGTMTGNIVINYSEFGENTAYGGFVRFGSNYLHITNDAAYYNWNTLLHSGNYSDYALPLSGGQITGRLELYDRLHMGSQVIEMGKGLFGAFEGNESLYWYTPTSNIWNTLIHSGNIGSHALTLDGGYLNNNRGIAWYNNVCSWDEVGDGLIGVSNVTDSLGYYAGLSFKAYYGLQIRAYGGDTDFLEIRGYNAANWGNWRKIIHSGNIGSQSVAYATSAGNADTLDGVHINNVVHLQDVTDADTMINGVTSYSNVDVNAYHVPFQGGELLSFGHEWYSAQLYVSHYSHRAAVRGLNYGTWMNWHELAFTDSDITGNAATATYASNAGTLGGYAPSYGSNTPWGTIPIITHGGWMEVGKSFEFHYDNTTETDFSTALMCTGNYGNTVNLPSASGTLALTTDNVASADYATTAGSAGTANSVAWDNVSGRPSSLPANGGNADTVDGQHFSYSNEADAPTWVWATNENGTSFLAKRANLSVNYANSASSATYDSNWNHIANTYATKSEIPSVGNGTVTITQNGTSKGSFTLNQSGNATIELTDTNTHPDLSGYATQSWVSSNFNYSTDSWRPITDSYSGSDQGTSLSQYGANALYNALVNGYAAEAGYASSAGSANSVAWSNVSGRPTSVSQFTNDSGYLNTSNVWNNPEDVTLGIAFGPTEMYNSIQGFINNGTVVVKNGTLYVMDNPTTPVSTHWLDAWSDPNTYGGAFYNGQIILDLYPDRFYDVTHNPLISTLTINSISGWNNRGLISHNIVRFKPGSSAFTLTLPSGIYWANGNPIECDDPDSIYEISFIKRSGGDEITATWTKFTQA